MRVLRVMGLSALAASILTLVAAYVLDRGFGRTLQPVLQAAPEAVALNRSLHSEGEPVAEIYGVPTGSPMRVLFVDKSRVIHPKEDPSLSLLLVNKQRGDNPLQVRTVWFIAWRLSGALAAAGALALLTVFLVGRHRARKAQTDPP